MRVPTSSEEEDDKDLDIKENRPRRKSTQSDKVVLGSETAARSQEDKLLDCHRDVVGEEALSAFMLDGNFAKWFKATDSRDSKIASTTVKGYHAGPVGRSSTLPSCRDPMVWFNNGGNRIARAKTLFANSVKGLKGFAKFEQTRLWLWLWGQMLSGDKGIVQRNYVELSLELSKYMLQDTRRFTGTPAGLAFDANPQGP